MARTASPARKTGSFIGACVRCSTRYYAASKAVQVYCSCRAGVECADARCLLWSDGSHDHPRTAVKWVEVKGRVSEHACHNDCQMATTTACSCSCAGRNHGRALDTLAA